MGGGVGPGDIGMSSDFGDTSAMGMPATEAEVGPPQGETDIAADPYAEISDALLLHIMNEGYARSREARRERNRANELNWKALHGQFEFLNRKMPGQSRIVIPALEVALEQIAGTLTDQLVGFKNWFQCEYETGDPPLPEMGEDVSASVLREELDQLAIEGNYLASTYGIRRLVYDSIKVALIESVATWKVSVVDVDDSVYDFAPDGAPMGAAPIVVPRTARRLRVEIVPFADHYPDPSPAKMFDIHEVEVPIADLPALGFDELTIQKMRGILSTEKEEQRRIRSGAYTTQNVPRHRVILREWWGDLVDPHTGRMLAENITFTTAGSSMIVKRPTAIRELLWHGKRPWICVPLLPTPLSHIHHAFLDIARPLVETESELTNLVIDGGFGSVHGIKTVREYAMEDPSVIANGLVPGITIKIAEGHGDAPVVERIDSGMVTKETIDVLDRISRMRQESFRISDLQLGRLPQRKESATAITEVTEASNDLFSSMAQRFEKSLESLIELCWLTMWQFLDSFEPVGKIAKLIGPAYAQSFAGMSPQERFILMANGIRFKVTGYKSMLASVKDYQKLLTLRNYVSQNPALLMVWQQEFSLLKEFRLMYRALGIDPLELRRDPDEPMLSPEMLMGQAGNPGGQQAGSPAPGGPDAAGPPTNAMGDRGIQGP
jgi:hypothetical protein